MEKITILLIDDHRLVRDMWGMILDMDKRLMVVGSFSGEEDIIARAKKLLPDIILMDIAMEPVSGFDLTEQLCTCPGAPAIIGVSMYNTPAYAKRMLAVGAKGYLTKNSSKEELIRAIIEVHRGRKYICEELRHIISVEYLAHPEIKPDVHLTPRELEVLNLVRQGLSSREISLHLEVETKTVEVHRYNILKKLHLPNTAALVNYANQNGL